MRDPDPWTALGEAYPGTEVHYRHLPDRWGQTLWLEDGTVRIELALDLDYVQQRCTLAHELHHLIAGRPCVALCDTNEREVVEATARWLLPDLAELGGLLRRLDAARAAARLDVTVDVVNDRVVTLTPAERETLAGILGPGTDAPATRAAHGARRNPPPPHRCGVRRKAEVLP